MKSIISQVLSLSFILSYSIVYAECSKKELLQFIELGFSKKEIQQICKTDSIEFESNIKTDKQNENDNSKSEIIVQEQSTEDNDFEESTERKDTDYQKFSTDYPVQTSSFRKSKNNRITFEIGGMTGSYDIDFTDDSTNTDLGTFDHKLGGTLYLVSFQHKLNSDFVVGVGYQSFKLEGESDQFQLIVTDPSTFTTFDFRFKIKTNEFSGTGLVGIFGYDLNLSPKIELTPQLRVGVANELKLVRTLSLDVRGLLSTSVKQEVTESASTIGIALPVSYKFEDFGLGITLYALRAGFERDDDGSKEEIITDSGAQLLVSHKF